MMAGTGVWFKNIDAHHLLIKAIQMRFDAKHVTKDLSKQKHLEHEMQHYEEKHNIEKIGEILKSENHVAEDAMVHSHRLLTLDLLILYGLIQYCEKFAKLLRSEEKHLRSDSQVSREEKVLIRRALKELGIEEMDLKEAIGDIKDNLQKENRIILALDEVIKGKFGAALAMKEYATLKNRWVRYFVMRFETVGAKKQFKGAAKNLEKLMPLILHMNKMEQKRRGGEVPGKLEKELKKIKGTEKKFIGAVKKCAEKIHGLFVNDALVVRVILVHFYKERKEDIKLAAEHEIPLALAEMDEAEKQHVLDRAAKRLHEERKDILQIWKALGFKI